MQNTRPATDFQANTDAFIFNVPSLTGEENTISVPDMQLRLTIQAFLCAAGFLLWSGPAKAIPLFQMTTNRTELIRSEHKHHWWQVIRPRKKTPAEQMAYSARLVERGCLRSASRAYRALVYTWPESPEAPEAQITFARLLDKREHYADAFSEYQFLIQYYQGYFSYNEVIQRQYELACLMASTRRGFLFIRWNEREKAISMFETILQNAPYWAKADEMQFEVGRIYEEMNEQEMAIVAYSMVQQRYPKSSFAEPASFYEVRCCYTLTRRHMHSSDLRMNAAAMARDFLYRYPRSEFAANTRIYLNELYREQSAALYLQALIYERMAPSLNSAIIIYERLIKEYPASLWVQPAQARILQLKTQMLKENNED